VLCAAGYLGRRGVPRQPEDLTAHSCLTYEYLAAGAAGSSATGAAERAVDRRGRTREQRQPVCALAVAGWACCSSRTSSSRRRFAQAGSCRCCRSSGADLDDLRRHPSRRHLSAKVRLFVDALAERFAGRPEWALDG
jgi:DNA-binding transcriptional LysR family regulator